MHLSHSIKEKIYAGVLGKIIGVYAGRPFENWQWEKIEATFGEINRYVNLETNEDLIVADDDVTGTSMFVKALQDHKFRDDFSSKHIGQSWLDILIENKTVFWWGGYNMSTEHTAYLNLKQGIEAPHSGSIETNGKISAEQIGAQIFIDYWGLINPSNPDRAVKMAIESARVGHDGEAVYGATVIAALVSLSFEHRDLNHLLDSAIQYISSESSVYQVIEFVRSLHQENPDDWRWAFTRLREEFGYDKFGGMCHMVPNHGLIILSLLYGGDSFHKSMVIVNTLGWDTDCNAANVGCINAVRLGLDSISAGYDWRTPVADRIYLPTAHSTDNVTDAVREANELVAIAEKIEFGTEPAADLPRFNFNYRGSVQGFEVQPSDAYDRRAHLNNAKGEYLEFIFDNVVKGSPAIFKTLTHTCETDDVRRYPYHLLGSPTLFSGQKVVAQLSCDINQDELDVTPYIVTFDQNLERREYDLDSAVVTDGELTVHSCEIPQVNHEQITYFGFKVGAKHEGDCVKGCLKVHSIDWSSTPSINVGFHPSSSGQWVAPWWANSFISTMTQEMLMDKAYLMNDTHEKRVFVYGSNDFCNYDATLKVTPQSNEKWSVLFNYQGLNRHLEARFDPQNDTLSLIERYFESERVIDTVSFKFEQRNEYEIKVHSSQDKVRLLVEDAVIECSIAEFEKTGLTYGCIGVASYFGSMQLDTIKLSPVDNHLNN